MPTIRQEPLLVILASHSVLINSGSDGSTYGDTLIIILLSMGFGHSFTIKVSNDDYDVVFA